MGVMTDDSSFIVKSSYFFVFDELVNLLTRHIKNQKFLKKIISYFISLWAVQ